MKNVFKEAKCEVICDPNLASVVNGGSWDFPEEIDVSKSKTKWFKVKCDEAGASATGQIRCDTKKNVWQVKKNTKLTCSGPGEPEVSSLFLFILFSIFFNYYLEIWFRLTYALSNRA